MSSPVVIRSYEPGDAEACRRLWAELTVWHRDLYDDSSIGGDDPGSGFDDYVREHGIERIRVAESGSVVGLVGLIARDTQAEIEPVIVSPGVRGRGIGRALVEASVEAARAEDFAQIMVRPVARNEDAIRFFRALGFGALGHVDLLLDLKRPEAYWRPGAQLAGRDFDV